LVAYDVVTKEDGTWNYASDAPFISKNLGTKCIAHIDGDLKEN